MVSRRVRAWSQRFKATELTLAPKEYRLHHDDHLSVVTDEGRAEGIEILFRDQYEYVAPLLADRLGGELIPIDRVRVRYDRHLRRAHADTLLLSGGARIRLSTDMVNILFAWIRNACSALSVPGTDPEPTAIVVSRVARALDLVIAPMLWTRQYWSDVAYHRGVAESFTQAAERFVLAHEMAHVYLADETLAAMVHTWPALSKQARAHHRELAADAAGLRVLLDFAREFGRRESRSTPEEAVLHGAAGAALTLSAMDLLERFDVRYATTDCPRAVVRRAHMRKALRETLPAVAARIDQFEVLADHVAGRALYLARRRRRVAAQSAESLLTGADGTARWGDEDVDGALRATLRHSRVGTLETISKVLATAGAGTPAYDRAAGFVQRFLVDWQGEPVYLPFLSDIEIRVTT